MRTENEWHRVGKNDGLALAAQIAESVACVHAQDPVGPALMKLAEEIRSRMTTAGETAQQAIVEPEYKNPVCRGSFLLGSACNRCERCEWRRKHVRE